MSTFTILPRSTSEIEVDNWPLEALPHISSSSLRMFKRCPEQYRRRYLLGEKVPPNANLIWGQSDHAAIEYDMAQKIDTHEDLDVDTIMDVASETWIREVDLAGGPSELDYGTHAKELGDKPSPGDLDLLDIRLRNTMLRLVALYRSQVCPEIQPVTVERRFEIEIPGVPVPVVGYVDLEEATQIRERKSGARLDPTIKGDWLSQGRLYMAMLAKPVQWDVSLRQTKPRVEANAYRLEQSEKIAEVTKQMAVSTVGSIAHMLSAYGIDQPWPDAIEHPWSCQYCGWGPKALNVCYWHTGQK